jgi:hypothetical protein
MSRKQFYKEMTTGLRGLPRGDLRFAFGFAAVILILHVCSLAAQLYRLDRDDLPILRVLFVPRLLVVLAIMILVSAIGLWTRKAEGFFTSMVALLGVHAAYLLWYWNSRQILASYISNSFFQLHPEFVPHPILRLIGAQGWNLVVLAMAAALLIRETKTLVVILSSLRRIENQT